MNSEGSVMSELFPSTLFISRVLRGACTLLLLSCLGGNAFAQLPRPPGEQQLQATTEEMSSPTPASPPTTLFFGQATAIEGRTLLVGMPAYSDASINAPTDAGGRVAVFSLNGASRWVRTGSIDPTPRTPNDEFGSRIALADGYALIAANSGVFVFKRRGQGWLQVGKLVPAAGEHFDRGLAISRGSLLVGVRVDDAPGRVYAYEVTSKSELKRVQTLQASASEEGDDFGLSLSASKGSLVVGAPGFDEGLGAAFVYNQAGNQWAPAGRLSPTDQDPATSLGEVNFGWSVHTVKGLIVVGAIGADRHAGQCEIATSGAAYVFVQGRKSIVPTQKLPAPGECTVEFGYTVAISRDFLVVGALSVFPATFNGAHVYRREDDAYVRRFEVFASEVDVPRIALDGSHFVAGFPSDRFFKTGFALAYDLAEAP
jgi:hypothetical protein